MAVPYTFGSATTSIPLSQLDSNFATTITLGNTAIQLGNTVTTLNNMTLANATVSSGNVTVLNATVTNDASISGLTVGKGGGAVASNTATGASALSTNSSGGGNSGFGNGALASSSTGNDNAAFGYHSLYVNTASQNSAFGSSALAANTSGGNNTALGQAALASNTTASNNTAVGYQAGYASTGTQNAFFGYVAGLAVTTGANNTFIGTGAGVNATTGTRNTFVGVDSGISGGAGGAITTGSKNTIIGGYTGNNGGLDIRTASNYIVLSDGDGNPRVWVDNSGNTNFTAGHIGLQSSGSGVFFGTNNVLPSTGTSLSDNTKSFGNASWRWSVIYAGTGTINTSDATQKQQIRNLNDAEKTVAQSIKGLIKAYKFNDSVAEKGDGARIHIGVIAQEVQAAFEAQGLDSSKYAMFCSDTWYEVDGKPKNNDGFYTKDTPNAIEVTRLGIRYDELLAFVIAAM